MISKISTISFIPKANGRIGGNYKLKELTSKIVLSSQQMPTRFSMCLENASGTKNPFS